MHHRRIAMVTAVPGLDDAAFKSVTRAQFS
jgi:hypothetical protein